MTRMFVLTAAVLWSAAALATKEVGNGGQSVRCPVGLAGAPASEGRTILDLYESSVFYGFHYDRLASLRGLPFEKAFEKGLDLFFKGTLMEPNPFREWFGNRAAQMIFEDRDFDLQGDSFSPIAIAHGCKVEQVIVQYLAYGQDLHNGPRLRISVPRWRKLSTDLQVALLLHEYVLLWSWLTDGSCGLANVRPLTGFVLSDEARRASPAEWDQWIHQRRCDGTGR